MIIRGQLRDYFAEVGVKRLSAVDAEPARSNQHEIGTTRDMRDQFLGEVNQEFKVVFIWMGGDEDEEILKVEGTATHYDARKRQKHRSPEWRLYYPSNPVTELMREGDALFLAKRTGGALYFMVAPAGSTGERQLSWLFGLEPNGQSFMLREFADREPALDLAADWLLENLGITIWDMDTSRVDKIIESFAGKFPCTKKMSTTARESVAGVDAANDPDQAIWAWLDAETAIFRRMEYLEVDKFMKKSCEEISKTNTTNVECANNFFVRINNRRKSRRGYSLENHLEAVFEVFELSFDRVTTAKNERKPDFLFPGMEAYRNAPNTGHPSLVMLEAKSTCKERWRQIRDGTPKIPVKHLLTLDTTLSEAQTNQMKAGDVQLVMPHKFQKKYTKEQRDWFWNLADFIEHVRKQAGK